ncbi:TspO/MBR family protein [Winogradskyella sp.]|uniref:TspO/MBR family protein n=1 Tax=Winogradskyella sp. TaxID=1883156 RepID=UPI003F6D8493
MILFLVLNFGGLAIGNYFMGDAVNGKWYANLNKAPWTPPGWVFGAAWTTIMICFSIYLTYLFSLRGSKYVIAIYCIAFILNVSWNYLFFNQQFTSIALFVLISLTLVIAYFFISFGDEELSKMKYLLLPYIVWLCIAISLNGYVVLKN